ncbi:hypothetical protein QCA50_010747 [Cerrena zonata]|uniref:Uncharacterized protein n=1 Tax=Cerrena zonata TaxID=2478898 RepID=A0AAW0G7I2_9APHY
MIDNSLAVDEDKLICEMWSTDLPRFKNESATFEQVPNAKKVPQDRTAMYAWARVTNNPRPLASARSRALLLVQPTNPEIRQQVAFKVQGFVARQSLNLGTLGNWSGKLPEAGWARQTLNLVEGQYPEPFNAQYRALSRLIDYCKQHLPADSWSTLHPKRLEMERPVFTKTSRRSTALPLSSTDDPFGQAAKVNKLWVVTERLQLGTQGKSSGKIVACDASSIRAGDFVEVTCVLDMATKGFSHKKVAIRLWMTRVIQLADRNNVRKVTTDDDLPTFNTMDDDFEWDKDDVEQL